MTSYIFAVLYDIVKLYHYFFSKSQTIAWHDEVIG